MAKHRLTNKYYYGTDRMLVAVDCIIFGFDVKAEQIKILLFPREIEPFQGSWSLIGSFVQKKEDIDKAAARILRELTGLDQVFLEQHKVYGHTNRDPGDRVISISYWSFIKIEGPDRSLIKDHNAEWFPVRNIPKLVIDHNQMVEDALSLMRKNARYLPIGFELLPEKFTLPQLLKLYQEIYQKPIDDRNFRKKILATGLLKKLDSKDKTSSKKGAFQYSFDQTKYEELLQKGFDIEFQ